MNKSNQIKNYKGMQESPFNKGAGTRRVTGGSLKTNKGITLIALIITIIIMLILVGVTITVAVNGGLFEYAGRAGKETNEAIENEKLLAEGIINGQTIDDILGIAVKDDWYGITEEMETQEGVTEYHIQSCAELKKFANAVNAGNDFAGKTVYLDKNLDLQGNESKQWTPIGNYYRDSLGNEIPSAFKGIFDGNNHYIGGIYIYSENPDVDSGLFGMLIDGSIKNVKVVNGCIKSSGVTGGIVGYMSGEEYENSQSHIQNCYNNMIIDGGADTGGILGYGYGRIENCYNEGEITSKDTEGIGGIAGQISYGTIKKCYNIGEIIGRNCSTGGIVGWNEEGNLIIEDCYNIGTVKSSSLAGGIIVIWGSDSKMKNCYNIGEVEGTTVGKIAGEINSNQVTNCYFLGTDSDNAVGNNPENVSVDATPKTESEMKTQEFVDLLNAGQTTAPWKYVQNSYPILSWQK